MNTLHAKMLRHKIYRNMNLLILNYFFINHSKINLDEVSEIIIKALKFD